MDVLTQIVVWLNAVANAVGRLVLAPIGLLPGWLSATMVAVVTGVGMLFVFKYTSNQRAIKAVRDALNEKAPNAEVADIDKQKKSGHYVYKITFKEPGRNPALYFNEDGTIYDKSQDTK